MIVRKSPDEVKIMARAGRIVAELHQVLRDAVGPGVTTMQLDEIAERELRKRDATSPFKWYRGTFPGTICTSVNSQIVHGIPATDVVLREGDLVKLDVGAVFQGYHGDSAATWIVGGDDTAPPEVRDLVARTREGLWGGLLAAVAGRRLSDISAAVEAHALPHGYGVVREYVGHGIGRALHEDPQVPNYGRPGRGVKLVPGLVLAVEPMFNLGTNQTRTLDDEWTVVTADGALSSHWEHTVAITPDGPWVLTAREDEPEWPLAERARVPGSAGVDGWDRVDPVGGRA
jgi:methionyl aminopeptidase